MAGMDLVRIVPPGFVAPPPRARAAAEPRAIQPRPIPRREEEGLGFFGLLDSCPSRLLWFGLGAAVGGFVCWKAGRKYGRVEDRIRAIWSGGA